MKNIAIFSFYGVGSYSRAVMAEVLQKQLDLNENNRIFFISCSKSFDFCYFNFDRHKSKCETCKFSINNTLELIEGNYKRLDIREIIESYEEKESNYFFRDYSEIDKNIYFENFEIGEAVISSYISKTRDKDLTEIKRKIDLIDLAKNVLTTYLSVKRFLIENQIEEVYNFNGRQDYLRAIFKASKEVKIDCYNVERTRPGGYIDYYKNEMAISILAKKRLIDQFWEKSGHAISEKEKISEQFFLNKKNGKETITKSYTNDQIKDLIPDIKNNLNPIITLYNSSDDEHAATGEVYKNEFFENQFEGILFLINLFGEKLTDYNLVIRMHPNLKNVKYNYVRHIIDVKNKFDNIYVIAPEEKMDSYSLMEKSYKVITFGSTIGLESSYFRKPVILLGKGRYYYSDVAYVPKNIDEIETLIINDIPPKPKVNSQKFGYYYILGGVKSNYYYQKGVFSDIYFKGKNLSKYKFYQKVIIYIIKLIFK